MAIIEFINDDGLNIAAGLAFFGILAAIPIVMIIISIVGHFIGQSEQLFAEISNFVMTTLPQVQPEFIESMRLLVDKKVTSGWIGILFLFFVASMLFTDIEHILDKVLKSSKKRNFWHSRILSIALIFVVATVFFSLGLFNFLGNFLGSFLGSYGVDLSRWTFIQGNASYLIVHTMVFVLLLKLTPNESIRMRNILGGGFIFGSLTVLARMIFRWYMQTALDRYHFIYGSLTLIVLLVLWIYYLSVIFVFCAELVNVFQKISPAEAPDE